MTRVDPAYFPRLTFGHEVEQDDLIQQWFGKHLRSMDEPRLYLDHAVDAVRVLTLPTFHAPRLVRFHREPKVTRITAKETTGRGGYGAGRLSLDKTIDASTNLFDEAMSALTSIDFWKRPTLDNAVVKDGTRYVIESRIADKYHVIERASLDCGERDLLHWINVHTQGVFQEQGITKR